MFEKIEKPAGTAADVDHPQAALIAPGEKLVQRRQRLPPDRVGRPVEQDLDLGVVTPGRILRQPAARLEMEILQIITGSLAAHVLAQHLSVLAALAAAVHLRQIGKEQPGTAEQIWQGAVVIRGQRVDAGFDIGEVLLQQDCHIAIEARAVGDRGVGMGAPTRRSAVALARSFRQAPHDHGVSQVPCDTRQLARAVSDARGEAGGRIGHAVFAPMHLCLIWAARRTGSIAVDAFG